MPNFVLLDSSLPEVARLVAAMVQARTISPDDDRRATLAGVGCKRWGEAMADNILIGELSGSDATDRLREAIEKNQKATNLQTRAMIWLNVVMTALTILMAIPTAVQIWDAAVRIWSTVRPWLPWE